MVSDLMLLRKSSKILASFKIFARRASHKGGKVRPLTITDQAAAVALNRGIKIMPGITAAELIEANNCIDAVMSDAMTAEAQAAIKKATRARLCICARRSLGRGERITPEMADAIFFDGTTGKPLPLSRAEQAQLIVFGKIL